MSTTTTTIELNLAKRKLSSVLGDMEKTYFAHLKSWFRRRITKDEFDVEARKLLAPEHGHLHNEFFLAILNKCRSFALFQPSVLHPGGTKGSSGKPSGSGDTDDRLKMGAVKRRSKHNRATFDHNFFPVDLCSVAPDLDDQQQLHQDGDGAFPDSDLNYGLDARDGMMPDASMVQGRLLVAAWEEGLEGGGHADPEVISLICLAAEQQVRSVIAALLMDRRGFRLLDGRFAHAVGVPAPDPWLRNSKRRRCHAPDGSLENTSDSVEPINLPLPTTTTDGGGTVAADHPPFVPVAKPAFQEALRDSMVEIACGSSTPCCRHGGDYEPISLFDLLATLQKHKRIIPSHSVYAVNLERVISRLHHEEHHEDCY